MAINDGKKDGAEPNVGWMEVLYRGWPYLLVVALRRIAPQRELLINYDENEYWVARDEEFRRNVGAFRALDSKEAAVARKALEKSLR